MTWINQHLEHDWFPGPLPPNVEFASDVYIDNKQHFQAFFSRRAPGLRMGRASGSYGNTSFAIGEDGYVEVGEFTALNSTTLICHRQIMIGNHCMFAWGSVITDMQVPRPGAIEHRQHALLETAQDPSRRLRPLGNTAPVWIEDNVWVGFDAIVQAGVRLGRGSVIGCKAIVTEDVPPYAVVVGNPARVVRCLDPDDTLEARNQALRHFGLAASDYIFNHQGSVNL